jgi:hypothetical protein
MRPRPATKAPPHIAKSNEEHPEWHIVRWPCRALSQREN